MSRLSTRLFHMFFRLENEVIRKIINENPQYSEKLLYQYENSEIINRVFTGHGFYTHYNIKSNLHNIGKDINVALSNIGANLNSMKHGVGFVLFVRSGNISCLEGYAYDEPWPDKITEYNLF
jgi:hypothetical protein